MHGAPRVVIVGGGPAGAVAARVLASRGVRPIVLEALATPQLKVGETLPPGLNPLLRHLGLDTWLQADGHLRSQGNRSFWGSTRPAESPFLANAFGNGWHVDRRRFEARLAETAQEAGTEWRWGARLASCMRSGRPGRKWRIEVVQAGRREALDVDFVADATGRPARLARRLGARRVRYDRLTGITGLLESPTPAADTYTLVEATPGGWWYSALLADGRLAVAFLTDGDLLSPSLRCSRADPDAWWRLLLQTDSTRKRVAGSGYFLTAPLKIQPAESSRLDSIVGDGWIALGDAAAAYDPLSSHGVASAMGSGYYGGHAIADLLAGRAEARLAYLGLLEQAYGTYLAQQKELYAQEARWPDAPFWRRRQEGVVQADG